MDRAGSFIRRAVLSSPLYKKKLDGSWKRWRDVPLTTYEELLREARSDPYAARLASPGRYVLAVELEGDHDPSLYVALDRAGLRTYAKALGRCWAGLRLQRGDVVGVFDYGSSPVSYLASRVFVPYLNEGPAEAFGCSVVCNDGSPEFAERAVQLLRYYHPKALFVRWECLRPLLRELERHEFQLKNFCSRLVVEADNQRLSEKERNAVQTQHGVTVTRLLRVDEALFLAAECFQCKAVHASPDFYHVEVFDGSRQTPHPTKGAGNLVITTLFNRVCPSVKYLTTIRCRIEPRRCPADPSDIRIALCP